MRCRTCASVPTSATASRRRSEGSRCASSFGCGRVRAKRDELTESGLFEHLGVSRGAQVRDVAEGHPSPLLGRRIDGGSQPDSGVRVPRGEPLGRHDRHHVEHHAVRGRGDLDGARPEGSHGHGGVARRLTEPEPVDSIAVAAAREPARPRSPTRRWRRRVSDGATARRRRSTYRAQRASCALSTRPSPWQGRSGQGSGRSRAADRGKARCAPSPRPPSPLRRVHRTSPSRRSTPRRIPAGRRRWQLRDRLRSGGRATPRGRR